MTGTTKDPDDSEAPAATAVTLAVCTTCRAGLPVPEDGLVPGARMFAALSAADLPEGVRLRGVECLSACARGCALALCADGRWTYVYGNLAPDQAAVVTEGAAKFAATPDGLVPWRERPEHFRKNCIARIPPMEAFE